MSTNNLFFSYAYDKVKNPIILSNDFVMYLTKRIIIKNPELIWDLDKLYDVISIYYETGTMKFRNYKKEVIKHFSDISSSNRYTQLIHYSEHIQAMVSRAIAEGKQIINDKLISSLMDKTVNDDSMCYIMALDAVRTGNTIDYYGYLSLNMFKDFAEKTKMVENAIANIDDSYYEIPISCVIDNDSTVDVLTILGCTMVTDLKSIPSEALVRVGVLDFEGFIEKISSTHSDFKDFVKGSIRKAIDFLSVRDREILRYRNGFEDNILHTLEETGNKYSLTRERIRQLEAKASDKLVEEFHDIKSYVGCIFRHISQGKEYIAIKELEEYMNDDYLASFLVLAISLIQDLDIAYDSKNQILVDVEGTTYDEIKELQLCKLNNIITKREYSELPYLQKVVVDENYNIKKGAYIKKGINSLVLLDAVIKDVLPDGYHNGDMNDYEKVIKEGKERYGEEFDYGTEHALMASIDRMGYILINRGTYKNKELCARLTSDLLAEITDYIARNMPIVFYKSIYDEFHSQLEEIGINNHYYLKGVLDTELPEGMHTKRDYITGEKGLSSREAILQKMKSFQGVFSYDDLRNTFPSVPDYVFTFVILENREFLLLGKNKYVHYNFIGFDETDISQLKEEIDKALSLSGVSFVTDRKVYARLKLFNKGMLEKIKYIDDHVGLFSLINYLFSDNYYLKRPFISTDDNATLSNEAIVANYVSQMNEFTSKTINDYCQKLNMRGLNNYLEFMDVMSDEFVQVSKDKMVKKDQIGLSAEILEEIRSVIETVISYSGKIDTRFYKGYGMLPKIKYPWNKYLLVGIVRTYMDQCLIEVIGNSPSSKDFIITKSKG